MKQFTLCSILFSLLFLFSSVLWANSYDAHIEQGNFFNDRGQTRKAHKEYLEAYAKASNQREQKTAIASLAVTSLNLGKRSNSERYLREFLSISPNNQWAKRFAKQYNLLTNKAANTKYRLTINATPSNSKIRVMNIKPKYRSGILLKPGKYDIEVTHPGYESKRWWVEIENADLTIDVALNKLGAEKSPTILPRQTDITLDELGTEKSQTKKIFFKGNNISNTDNIALWQYALQLRKTKPDLFAGAQGVVLLEIKPDSQAEKNGLQRGDIIIAYGEQPINSVSQLANIIQANTTKQQVKLRFIRANTVQTVRLRDGQIGNPLATSVVEKFSFVEWFEVEFLRAFQAQDSKKINQLFIDNPHLVSQYQLLLTRIIDKGTKEQAEQARALAGIVEEFLQNIYFPPSYLAVLQLQVEGMKAYTIADYSTALTKLQSGLKQARELGHQLYMSACLDNIGLVYSRLGQYQKALDYHQQALVIIRNIGDINGFGNSLANMGNVYKNWGQYPKALEHYQQALLIHRDLGNKIGEGTSLTNMGIIYTNWGQYKQALEYFQSALTIDRDLDDKNGEGTDLTNIGKVYGNLGQYQKALDYYHQALAITRKISNKYGEGIILHNIGGIYNEWSQYQKALDYLEKALQIRRKIGDKAGEGSSLSSIGVVYNGLSQFQRALDYLERALKIKREIGDRYEEGNDLNNIGITYQYLGKFQKSLDYLQEALKITREIGDKPGVGNILGNIGHVYQEWEQPQKALEYYQQGLAIFREIESKSGEAKSLGNIGTIYRNLGKTQKALTHHQQALVLDEELGDKAGKGADLMNIGVVYIDLEQYQTALDYFQRSLKIMRDIGNKLGEAKNLDNIAKVYQSWGQYQKYSDYHQQALAIYREIDYPHISNHDDSGRDFYDKAFKIAGIILLLLFIIGLTRSKTKTK